MSSCKRALALLLSALLLFALAACGGDESGKGGGATQSDYKSVVTAVDGATVFTERDLRTEYDASAAVKITLSDGGIDAPGLAVSGNTVFITADGVYEVSGELENGQIRVAAGALDKVQIVLCGVALSSTNSAALYVQSADKVFLTVKAGTENTLKNNGAFVTNDGNNVDGAIFSKCDLTVNGTGKLTVATDYGNGIVCKDDLVVAGTEITVTAAGHAVDANDSLRVESGKLTLTAGKDAVHVENVDDVTRGNVYIKDVTLTAIAAGDGIDASGYIEIISGSLDLKVGGGSGSASVDKREGIKAGATVLLKNGTYSLNCNGDAIRAVGNIQIDGGSFTVATGDDAVQSDGVVQFNGSNLKEK